MTAPLPNTTQAVLQGETLSLPYRRWAEEVTRLANAGGDAGLLADVEAIARALGSPDGTVENIPDQDTLDGLIIGRNGVVVTGRLGQDTVFVELSNPIATAADLAYDNTTSGLGAGDVQAALDELATGGGGGGMTLVGTATVSGSAATSLTLTGLDLGADGGVYRVVYALTNATASASDISLYFSGDTTATNYYTQQILANGSTISANTGRTNTAKVIGMNLSTSAVGAADIVLDGLGYIRGVVTCARDQTTGMLLQMAAIQHKTTGNLTSLTFTAAVAGALAVGSYFKVLKVG